MREARPLATLEELETLNREYGVIFVIEDGQIKHIDLEREREV